MSETAREWARELGLAEAPMFSDQECDDIEKHRVLLDGGSGSFALSIQSDGEQYEHLARSWAWSADLSHHVSVTRDKVEVTRWDDPSARRAFSRKSVQQKLEPFYRFLAADRVTNNFSVVDHALDLFRRLRALVIHQNNHDDSTVHIFLFALAALISGHADEAPDDTDGLIGRFALSPAYADVIRRLDWRAVLGLLAHYMQPRGAGGSLDLLPHLMVRHAGGLVFQEAHYELLSSGPPDMFGYTEIPEVKISSRGGT